MTWNRITNRARRAQHKRPLALESLEERRVLSAGDLLWSTTMTYPVVTLGQFSISEATDSDGDALTGTVPGQIDQLRVKFQRISTGIFGNTWPESELMIPINATDGTNGALNPANWRLFNGATELIDPFSAISVNDMHDTVTLNLAQPLRSGEFRLVARDTIADNAGNFLDGDGNGTPGGDFSRSFTVSDTITQGPPQAVSLPFSGGYVQTDLARNAHGDFVTVTTASWISSGNGVDQSPGYAIVVQRFNTAGVKQGDDIVVDESLNVGAASIAIDDAGNFVVSWVGSLQTGSSQIFARRYAADGTALGDKFAVSQTGVTGGHAMMDADGNFVITWGYYGSLDDSANGLYARRYDANGTALSDPQLIAAGSSRQLLSHDAAMNRDGTFAITWTMEGGLLFVARFAADGQPIGSTLNVAEGTWAYDPHVAIDDAGDIVVVWQRDQKSIMARRLSAAGEWLGYQFVVSDVPNVQQVDHAAVAMAPSGEFVVTWEVPTYAVPLIMWAGMTPPVYPHDTGIWAKAYDASGSAIDGPFRADFNSLNTNLKAGFDGSGDFVIGWTTFGGSLFNYREYSLATPLSVDLNGPAAGIDNAIDPQSTLTGVAIAPAAVIVDGASSQLVSATLSIASPLAGDTLSADTTGTNIVATFAAGVLSLTGADSVEHYQQVLRSVRFTSTIERAISTKITIGVVVHDGTATSPVTHSVLTLYQPGSSTIADPHLFYNRSKYDGNDAQADARDDQAIAVDKSALLPGQRATFANYTSYSRGINGLMIDFTGTHGTISADDFTFRIGNNNLPASWADAPPPLAVVTRPGAGVSGSDRVEIIWADGAIRNTWLEITVRANGDTGLAAPSVFYFGNAVGETGNTLADANINLVDVLRTFNHLHNSQETVGITDPYDFNRDGKVSVADAAIVVNQAILRLDGQYPDLARIQPPPPAIVPIVSITLSPPETAPPYVINLSLVTSPAAANALAQRTPDLRYSSSTSATADAPSTVDAAIAQWEAPDVLDLSSDAEPDSSSADDPATI